MAKKVLITGGRGFIAKYLISFLSERGYSVISYERDVTEKFEVEGSVDVVCHFAAKTFIGYCAEHPAETMRINFGGTLNALECAREKKAKFIFASAAAVYGVSNEGIREINTPKPNSTYGLSKYLAEQLSEFYAKSLGVPSVVLRLFNVYGPGQKPEFLIPTLVHNVAKGETVNLRSPKSVRDYIFIDDVLSLVELCVSRDLENPFNVFNVASGKGYSVKEVADLIMSVSGKSVPLILDEKASANVFTANIDNVKKVFGWEPWVGFKDGLKKTFFNV
ncbi:MAG: hypothetical protein A2836_02515 [Candidatus Taylorbacteria bacterium RIFCSPHIGHO2_01_FULL_45_63]|uniref:NAD-dependent epimerase/dehydratase domain-containing protein n=1 Tax=Candidatus Taylorbacteria bacterium RIFCSPHIGHO2_02_FULL_45_35 TaxID=1802311 RepID=A0A1G2MTP8_9BACT|nr:MAG: hypothetical protein A2836_02515 [Candidatus Taylorbacteria bacterium RIFCSPHIGHO2_01_FULL_45_63]OHA26589.1 MAG: hypothetical protein A3D56_03110 [Candidatus Taylorbacteria bacterium RIFCSPHIGHO2_02_FULL_45_35]OHA33283.1 MAG: hypothetical protein A3A22_01735 [Candidatus Taylorbacteria bacterium RIFCSPLOWO2_01_FULL_45_34b]